MITVYNILLTVLMSHTCNLVCISYMCLHFIFLTIVMRKKIDMHNGLNLKSNKMYTGNTVCPKEIATVYAIAYLLHILCTQLTALLMQRAITTMDQL
jgi:hypothetical protein